MMNIYTVEIERPDDSELALLAANTADINNYNSRKAAIVPDFETSRADTLRFVAVKSGAIDLKKFRENIQEYFGKKCKIAKLPPAEYTPHIAELASNAKALLVNHYIGGTEKLWWECRTVAEVEAEIDALTGFSDFKEAVRKISAYVENLKKTGGRANHNLVLVKNCEMDADFFTELLYSLYCAYGIVVDQMYVEGDLEDAAQSERDTAFFYNISERWPDDGARELYITQNERHMSKLTKRKTVYVTSMQKAQYERARELPAFTELFPTTIFLNELTAAEKLEYLKKEAASYGFKLIEDGFKRGEFLKNGSDIIKARVAAAVAEKMTDRACDFTLTVSDFTGIKKARRERAPFDELEALIGLDSVKYCIRQIVTYIENRGRDSLPCLHMVFRGNPGTGKTTVARIIGKILAEIGALQKRDVFVEADRNKLVSIYLGGTAAQTSDVVKSALGGVLFIDEAYALDNGERYDYGRECVNALVKLMEDHRREFVCIMAGYTKEMDSMLDMNPGLRERVQFYIDFPDYSASELLEIFAAMCRSEKYRLGAAAKQAAAEYFAAVIANKDKNFANGRIVRKVFERVKFKQAMRGKGNTIGKPDIDKAFEDGDLRLLCEKPSSRLIGFRPAG
jgi:AAA+ superfamily predicted ATPase